MVFIVLFAWGLVYLRKKENGHVESSLEILKQEDQRLIDLKIELQAKVKENSILLRKNENLNDQIEELNIKNIELEAVFMERKYQENEHDLMKTMAELTTSDQIAHLSKVEENATDTSHGAKSEQVNKKKLMRELEQLLRD